MRHRASEFFDSLSVADLARETSRHLWVSDWLRVADDYRISAESGRRDESAPIALEAWLCSLTALEVARSVSCPGDLADGDLTDRLDIGLRGLEDEVGPAIQNVKIDGLDQGPLTGLFRPAFHQGPSPVLICIADEEVALSEMMSRLSPALCRRNISLLIVHAGNSSIRRPLRPEHMLACWLDYLGARPDVDSRRIAVYGEGVGASHASRLALSDRRIAAAVCDGGIATPIMRRAWLRRKSGVEQAATPPDWLLPSRRIPCPLLVVVGSRSMVWEEDALALQTGYQQAGADCSTVVPNCIPHPLGEVENFVAVDDFILEWLDSKLGAGRQLDSVTYL
ncbi:MULTISPECIES: alpha/beta hydrolase [unclassified Bradyrhizobium]|uniref:alpha/beta hydrolase n=1 Tax=unclassified Bradyrhizobium TaxID=2631580 RepID=UPI002867EAF3|nr:MULTISPECIES: alpha/beta hydrolase [unclassified Bradyrhizobium]